MLGRAAPARAGARGAVRGESGDRARRAPRARGDGIGGGEGGTRGGALATVPTGSLEAQTMSDMMLMSAISPEDIVEARLIDELGTVTLSVLGGQTTTSRRCGRSATARRRHWSPRPPRASSWEFHALLGRAATTAPSSGSRRPFEARSRASVARREAARHGIPAVRPGYGLGGSMVGQ